MSMDNGPYVMVCMAGGDGEPTPFDGLVLMGFDAEFQDGAGLAAWTDDVGHALEFATPGEAMDLWRTVPKAKWLRDDGQPNRPMTAFTVAIMPKAEYVAEQTE